MVYLMQFEKKQSKGRIILFELLFYREMNWLDVRYVIFIFSLFISFHFILFILFHSISFYFILFHSISFHSIPFHFILFCSFHFISFQIFLHNNKTKQNTTPNLSFPGSIRSNCSRPTSICEASFPLWRVVFGCGSCWEIFCRSIKILF